MSARPSGKDRTAGKIERCKVTKVKWRKMTVEACSRLKNLIIWAVFCVWRDASYEILLGERGCIWEEIFKVLFDLRFRDIKKNNFDRKQVHSVSC